MNAQIGDCKHRGQGSKTKSVLTPSQQNYIRLPDISPKTTELWRCNKQQLNKKSITVIFNVRVAQPFVTWMCDTSGVILFQLILAVQKLPSCCLTLHRSPFPPHKKKIKMESELGDVNSNLPNIIQMWDKKLQLLFLFFYSVAETELQDELRIRSKKARIPRFKLSELFTNCEYTLRDKCHNFEL